MSNATAAPMAVHQFFSFSRLMTRIDRAEALFWPGCALMQLDPAMLHAAAGVLRRAEPDLGIAAACCGQPTRYLFPDKLPGRTGRLTAALRRAGVKRIYTACPNCLQELSALVPEIEIISLWPALAACLERSDLAEQDREQVTLHDPCPMAKDQASLAAVRQLLDKAGYRITEPANAGRTTMCCGNKAMMAFTDPERSAALRDARISQFPAGRTVTSPCAGCLDAFSRAGLDTAHLLELLFGKSKSKSWANRLRFARKK